MPAQVVFWVIYLIQKALLAEKWLKIRFFWAFEEGKAFPT